ncbi:MAG: lectin-like protein, partial [Bacteroidota bacterium]
GESASCNAFITVIDFFPPVVPVDDPDIDFSCPPDITLTPLPGSTAELATWTEPEATTTCTAGNGGPISCGAIPTQLSGFSYLGASNGSKYFLSNSTYSWPTAKAEAAANGGYLVSINNQAENNFIKNNINQKVWIGLTDENTEGTFEWLSGEPVTYTNWNSNEPNNFGSGEDATEMFTNGRWNDNDFSTTRKFVLEIPCSNTPPSCADVPTSLSGFSYVGEFNDSKYFLSNNSNFNFFEANNVAIANGGHLVTIADAAENNYVQNALPNGASCWLGISDVATEGTWEWLTGEPTNYLNWDGTEPNEGTNANHARLKSSNGRWTDRNGSNNHYYVVIEIDCQPGPISCINVNENISGATYLGEFGDSKYFVSNAAANWTTANAASTANGGHLAVIDSQAENDFIQNNINPATGSVWIGFNNINNGNNFQWVTGSSVVYTNWQGGEPNGAPNTHAARLRNDTGKWTDRSISTQYEYVFEIPCNSGGGSIDPTGGLTVQQISGGQNGSLFPVGINEVSYSVTDNCGNEEICTFTVTVEENPAEITVNNCPNDIVINTAPGAPTATATWTAPTATTDCFKPNANIEQTIGLESGSEFLIGTQLVAYSITDSCGNFVACSFNVTVEEVVATLSLTSCPGDQSIQVGTGTTSAIATWDEPTGTSDCFTGSVQANQLVGPTSGSSFPLGVTQVVYVLTDECGNSELCAFKVTISESCPDVGTPCDDGDASTFDDVEDGNCNCAGTPCPTLGASCDDGDASTFDDQEDGNCNCVGTPCPTAGTACDDGDATTENDVEDGNCNCAGTPVNCPDAGTPCDDGNANTENDVEDGNCNCAGTPIITDCSTPENLAQKSIASATQSSTQLGAEAARAIDGNTSGDFFGQNSVSLTNWETNAWLEIDLGLVNSIDSVRIWNREDCCQQFLSNYYVLVSDVPFASDDLTTTLNQSGVSSFLQTEEGGFPAVIEIGGLLGRYIRIQLAGTSFLAIAEAEVFGCISGTGCAPAGTACDDGDATTENDTEDGECNCTGTPCPTSGTACDDGNPNTENDVADGSCGCAGTPIGGGCATTSNLALAGTATQSSTQQGAEASRANDGNTSGNFFAQNSVSLTNWEAQPWWEVDLGEIGNIESISVWNREDCCQQFLSNYYVFVSDVPFTSTDLTETLTQSGVDNYLETIEAGNPTSISINRTGRYVRLQLQGTSFLGLAEVEVIGCLSNVPCLPAGTLCDDGDAGTENDVEDGNCNCAGTPVSCPDAGTLCDDGDATTENDVEDGNCNCAGTPVGCPDAGPSCNDGDANTENDVEDGNCNCAGTPINTGGCTTTTNVALNGTATQSSTLSILGITGSADKAIDGNTNGTFFTANPAQSSVSATQNISESYWEITLDDSYLIEQIDVYNRTDGADKTRDAYVLVSSSPFTAADLASARAEADWEVFVPGLVGSPSTVLPDIEGQYVRVQQEGTGYLVLAEVEIYGCTPQTAQNQIVPNMLYFNAEKEGIATRLDWMMLEDTEVDFYEVEVSTDGVDFKTLDELTADQVAAPRHYETMDRNPAFGENFYRLKVHQMNGEFFYSNVRRVNFAIDFDQVVVYPNPTDQQLNIALRDFAGKAGTIEIYNGLGQRMASRDYVSLPTIPAVFDVSDYVNGIYTISVKVENHRRFTKKFIVTKL